MLVSLSHSNIRECGSIVYVKLKVTFWTLIKILFIFRKVETF